MHRVVGERSLSETAVPPELARELLREMVRVRVFDERAVALQRRGWMSGYPPFRGQEASQVGAAGALADADRLFPTYRTNALQLARGRPPTDILRFRRGRSEYEDGREGATFTQSTPIATHLPHAVGAAIARTYRGGDAADGAVDPGVACAYFGDGATSEGDFHEALNFAGVFDAPTVFLCENNAWAISLPVERQTASPTLAAKADAYGFAGVRVDGMDPLAVYETLREARESALAGDPVLVESLTYRRGAHSTSDDPERYRDREDDRPDWRTADPLDRYETFLRDEGVVDDSFVPETRERAESWVSDAVERVERDPDPDPDDVFGYAYAQAPPRVEAQRRERQTRLGDVASQRDGENEQR